MLNVPTPFPEVGSYALLIDLDGPPPQPTELVRILERRGGNMVLVAFPLRDGAGGTKLVAFADLIDASPLSAAEAREFHDIDRSLRGREPRNLSKAQRVRARRRDELKARILSGPIMDRQLRFARAAKESYGASARRRAA